MLREEDCEIEEDIGVFHSGKKKIGTVGKALWLIEKRNTMRLRKDTLV
jgi:hypothetical protein